MCYLANGFIILSASKINIQTLLIWKSDSWTFCSLALGCKFLFFIWLKFILKQFYYSRKGRKKSFSLLAFLVENCRHELFIFGLNLNLARSKWEEKIFETRESIKIHSTLVNVQIISSLNLKSISCGCLKWQPQFSKRFYSCENKATKNVSEMEPEAVLFRSWGFFFW